MKGHGRNRKNLLGKRFGKLIVISMLPSEYDNSGTLRSRWTVKCDCGNVEKTITQYLLRATKPKIQCNKCRNEKATATRHLRNNYKGFTKEMRARITS